MPPFIIAEDGNNIQAIDFDNRGKTLLTGGSDLSVREYDAHTHKVHMSYRRFSKTRCCQSKSEINYDAHI